MGELISVIIPVYNMEQYLQRCVDSVLEQEYSQLEIILVDDGSTDASPAMCDAYAKKDNRVKVVHKENGGLSDARNAGMAVAQGAYIGFVDSDDWIEPGMYRAMYDALTEKKAQVAVCRYAEVCLDKVIDGSGGEVVALSREEVLDIYICEHPQYKIYNSVWSKLFKREIIQDMQFPKGRNSEDIMFTTRAFCRLETCVYLDTAYYNYVKEREGSIMNTFPGQRMLGDEIPFWREHIECIRETGLMELAKKAEYYFYKRLIGYYVMVHTEYPQSREIKQCGKALLQELKKDKEGLQTVYRQDFAKKSDRYRMQLVKTVPGLYVMIEKLYQKWIIPFRNRSK